MSKYERACHARPNSLSMEADVQVTRPGFFLLTAYDHHHSAAAIIQWTDFQQAFCLQDVFMAKQPAGRQHAATFRSNRSQPDTAQHSTRTTPPQQGYASLRDKWQSRTTPGIVLSEWSGDFQLHDKIMMLSLRITLYCVYGTVVKTVVMVVTVPVS